MHIALYRVAHHLIRLYWFLCRPRTCGARCILVYEDQVLLIRQTYGDRVWTLPGGGLARGETPEAAVRREVEEEVGVSLSWVQYLGQFVSTQTYNVDTIHVFMAPAPSQAYTLAGHEILEARWFAREALSLAVFSITWRRNGPVLRVTLVRIDSDTRMQAMLSIVGRQFT
jgi:8-oxo-dGTP pyrophosphatase MutT (NUDIX family)